MRTSSYRIPPTVTTLKEDCNLPAPLEITTSKNNNITLEMIHSKDLTCHVNLILMNTK